MQVIVKAANYSVRTREVTIMKFRFAVALAIVLLAASARAAFAQGRVMTFTVDGVKRQALVFAPKDSKEKAPLVFAWHGHGGNMSNASNSMKIEKLWPEAIVVYPQGLPTVSGGDPQGLHPGWQAEAGTNGDRDLKFFDAMLQMLRQKFSVDDERIYSMGFSNGAFFSYVLWSARPKPLAAFAICAGKLFPSDHLMEPRAVVVIAGTADLKVNFQDQQQAIQTAQQLDSATGQGQPCGQICMLYPSPNHTPVETFIHPGGHVYPPWASDPIVKFFKAHKHT
jgi:polyhydroxybutyrate depolymerase